MTARAAAYAATQLRTSGAICTQKSHQLVDEVKLRITILCSHISWELSSSWQEGLYSG